MNVGDVKQGKVVNIMETHILVKFPNEWTGLLHVSKVSDYYVSSLRSMFKKDINYWFEILSVDIEKKRVKLSWKSIMPRFVKDPFIFQIEETENGFKNLLEKTLEGAKSD